MPLPSIARAIATNRAQFAAVAGHGGIGVVEEVGRLVKRVKVGDQVMLATTPNCGVCWNCPSGCGDLRDTRLPAIPNATMSGNTPVYMTAPPMGPAGYSEIIVWTRTGSCRCSRTCRPGRVLGARLRGRDGTRAGDVPLPDSKRAPMSPCSASARLG